MNQYSGMDSLPIAIETQCFKMGSYPIFHRKKRQKYDCHAKRRMKKSLGEQTTRLILIPLLHTNIMLLLIHIMRLLFFFHKTSVRVHTFFLVILIGLQHIPSRLHMTFIKKTIITQRHKQTDNRTNS